MTIKVGIVGLRRGQIYINCFDLLGGDVKVTAFCDKNPNFLDAIKKSREDALVFDSYEDFLKSDIDIVVVATPLPTHAEFSIKALENGKHVLCEVPPVNSIDEAKALVKAVETSKKKYMLTQNTCYYPHIRAWKKIIEKGLLGELIYAEGEYIHPLEDFFIKQASEGNPWRAELPPLHYCTHSLGPLLFLMEDRVILAQGFKTDSTLNIPQVKNPAPRMEVGIFKTEKGSVIKILVGFGIKVKRASGYHNYIIYGTKGCLETSRVEENLTLAYFDDIPHTKKMIDMPLSSAYEAPQLGHGGTEYYLVKDFIECVLEDKREPIGIKEALSYGLPGICAHQSALNNGGVVKVPNFF